MRQSLKMLVWSAVLFTGAVASVTTVEARRLGGVHSRSHAVSHVRAGRTYRGKVSHNRVVRRDVNRNVTINRNVTRNVNRRYVVRNGQRGYWRNGLWIAAPVVAGAAYAASPCAYEYRRWQSTGSTYWRDRYYECTN